MAISGLMLLFSDYMSRTGGYLGWGLGATAGDVAWGTRKTNQLTAIVSSAVRQFYFPPILPGERTNYTWSFLQPTTTIDLASGDFTADLPDDFAGFEGPVGINTTGTSPWNIEPVHPRVIYQLRASSAAASGAPEQVAFEAKKGVTLTETTKYQLLVWPTPDQAYTLDARYKIIPEALSGLFPYIYGGPIHAETVLASCFAAAEFELDNKRDVRYQQFMDRLAASVSMDRSLKPSLLGYNGDTSDMRHVNRRRRDNRGGIVTVNGQEPS